MAPEHFAFSTATSPPSERQRQFALGIVAALFGLAVIMAPFASMPLSRFDSFYPTVDAIIFVTDVTTAVLLFNQFAIIRSHRLLILANGYLFSGLAAVPHALTFPGAFAPAGLLGAGLQSTPWLFTFWHFGFSAAVLAYASLKDRGHAESATKQSAVPSIYRSVIAVVGLVCLLTWGVTAENNFAPRLFLSEVRFAPLANYVTLVTFSTSLLALVLLCVRGRSVLDLWVGVAIAATLIEQGITTFLISSRFSLGFYVGAAFSVVVSAIVLMALLSEIVAVYTKLAYSTEDLQREREREQLLIDELNRRDVRLQEALAVGSVVAFEWDATTDLLRCSNNGAQILGGDPQQPFTGESFLSRVHPDDLMSLKALWRTLSRDNPTYSASYRFLRPDGREIWLQDRARADFDDDGRLLSMKGLGRDITSHKNAEERQRLLIAELDHRVKNILAQVAVVASSTRQGSRSMDEFLESLNGRLQSMAAAHTVLSESGWQDIELGTVVRKQLAAYATGTNVTITGSDVALKPTEIQAVAKVLHELATNAAKYGSLSVPGGQVSLNWDLKPNGNATYLILFWRESGGPPVAPKVQSATAQISYAISFLTNSGVRSVWCSPKKA